MKDDPLFDLDTRLDGSTREYGQFEVVWIDPQGSGTDYTGHLGKKFLGARCCKNCEIIFGDDGNFGPFTREELKSLDHKAQNIHAEIDVQFPRKAP